MPEFTVVIKKVNYRSGITEAANAEEAVNKIIMQAPGNPRDWELEDVSVSEATDGPTEHIEPGAISFM